MKKGFILGNPRSGTSLFRLMINAHPEMVAPPECGFLHWWYNKYQDWSINDNTTTKIKNFVQDLSVSRKIETWKMNYKHLEKFIEAHNPASYAKLVELIYIFYANSNGKISKTILDKNNYYINYIEDLYNIWTDAFYIQLVRDGRDVACSYLDVVKSKTDSVYKPILSSNIADIANEWSVANQKIYSFISKKNTNNFKIIKYEDLIENTKNTLKEVCEFLEMDFNENMLDYYKGEYHNEPHETMDWKRKTLSAPDPSHIGRYKFLMSKEDIEIFNQIAGAVLLQFNYEVQ